MKTEKEREKELTRERARKSEQREGDSSQV